MLYNRAVTCSRNILNTLSTQNSLEQVLKQLIFPQWLANERQVSHFYTKLVPL